MKKEGMKGKYYSIYLCEKRKDFIENLPERFSVYIHKKIDDDIEHFDQLYCEKQLMFWKRQKKMAVKRKKENK